MEQKQGSVRVYGIDKAYGNPFIVTDFSNRVLAAAVPPQFEGKRSLNDNYIHTLVNREDYTLDGITCVFQLRPDFSREMFPAGTVVKIETGSRSGYGHSILMPNLGGYVFTIASSQEVPESDYAKFREALDHHDNGAEEIKDRTRREIESYTAEKWRQAHDQIAASFGKMPGLEALLHP